MHTDLFGIIPPIVTPFTANGDVDEQAFRGVVRFMVKKKVHGICVGGSSGEGHTYSAEEFKRLNEIACEEVNGAIPVVAGIIVNSTRDAIARAASIAHLPIAGLQVTPVHYVFKPDEDATYKHFKALSESTKFPVIIYNVVPWNYLSPALLVRIMKDMPGVIGVKQSAGDLKLMADLLINLPKGKKVFSAVDALLYPSFALGAHGTIAANPAAVPGVCINLWNAVQAGDHKKAKEIHEALLRFWNTIAFDNLPANIKFSLSLQGCETGVPRMPMPATTPEQAANIRREMDQVLRYDN
ncbi:dihydrodipicolinate synthase family protein [Caenimonas soli]|uniref:dihydrodipicolinate synthase family protein n=1 Tax=Caenimonas soli TaxID=2735555 RepID=UPI00155678F1|nr:dihydrodipicolinate synthase family protein [Caenimonas soli]NPC54560.1 dihydrodipicolinate synthase family protein [Caenimonas soli]